MIRRLCAPLVLFTALVVGLLTSGMPFAVPLLGQGYSTTNPAAYWVAPGACNVTTSGVAAGTNGLTVAGASATPVVAAEADSGLGFNLIFICNISPPSAIITTGTGLQITDAVFAYSAVNALGTQSATLGSGTMNSGQVFSYIAYPSAAIGETPSTVTPVRADSGTLVITPVVASFNAATNTAGAFYTIKFAPAAGTLVWKTDSRQLLLTVTLAALPGLRTIVTSPGVLVHFKSS